MKTGIFSLAAFSLLQLSIAQPFGRAHRHLHKARDVVTDVDYVTVEATEVIVYVDSNGNPVSTETLVSGQPEPTYYGAPANTSPASSSASSTSASSSSTSSTSSTSSATSLAYKAPDTSSSTAAYNPPATSASSSSAPAQTSSSSSSGDGFGSAITYSPYQANGNCKSSDQVASDLSSLNYDLIRLYGVDCNQVANVLAATKSKGTKLFVGIFDITQISSEVSTLKSAVNGDWSRIFTVAVGNELVNSGGASVSQVVAAIGQARSALQSAGYSGAVVTVDTMVAMANNIALCTASDYCAINCHAFFDGKTTSDKAGPFVLNWAQEISAAAGGKKTVVTETGWPSQGDTNGMAVPNSQNQQSAVSSLTSTFSNNMILFTAYNDYWKKNTAGQFNAEQFWGIKGNAPS